MAVKITLLVLHNYHCTIFARIEDEQREEMTGSWLSQILEVLIWTSNVNNKELARFDCHGNSDHLVALAIWRGHRYCSILLNAFWGLDLEGEHRSLFETPKIVFVSNQLRKCVHDKQHALPEEPLFVHPSLHSGQQKMQ